MKKPLLWVLIGILALSLMACANATTGQKGAAIGAGVGAAAGAGLGQAIGSEYDRHFDWCGHRCRFRWTGRLADR